MDEVEWAKLEMCLGGVVNSSCGWIWIVEVVQEKEKSRRTHDFLGVIY